LHRRKPAALNGSILVVSNLRHDLSGMAILDQLASDDVLDNAYESLCRRRRKYSANSDVWAFGHDWPREKERIKGELLSGNFPVACGSTLNRLHIGSWPTLTGLSIPIEKNVLTGKLGYFTVSDCALVTRLPTTT
jgi:hypothetical protein